MMTVSNMHSLYEMDKGTLSKSGIKALKDELKENNLTYRPYPDRAGQGLCTVAAEIKRELDQTVTPLLKASLWDLTDERFGDLYCDVRIYPDGEELSIWDENDWAGTLLNVMVSFVIAVPPDDTLDSFARLSLVSLFSDDPMESLHDKVKDVYAFKKMLDVDEVNTIMGEISIDYFRPPNFAGMSLEIIFDACRKEDFKVMEKAALGTPIQEKKLGKSNPKNPNMPITLDNFNKEIPNLIAAIARELGVENIDPKTLKSSDSLYALMGFDHTLTLSLSQSIGAQFNVISMVGGDRMVTVGNALDFAEEMIMDADIEWEE